MFYEQARYEIIYNGSTFDIDEPKGWEDDAFEYIKNDKYLGVYVNISTSFKFYGYSAELLNNIYMTNGVVANAYLNKYEVDEDGSFKLVYSGWFDFNTYKSTRESVEIKFNSDPLLSLFKSKKGTKVEYSRDTKLNGNPHTPSSTRVLNIEGKPIYLRDELEMTSHSDFKISDRGQNTWNYVMVGFNLRALNQTEDKWDDFNVNEVSDANGIVYSRTMYNGISRSFYSVANKDRNLRMTLNYDVNVQYVSDRSIEGSKWAVEMNVYDNEGNYKSNIHRKEINMSNGTGTIHQRMFEIDVDIPYPVQEGESIALEHKFTMQFNAGYPNYSKITFQFGKGTEYANVLIQQDDEHEPTDSEILMIGDAFKDASRILFDSKFTSDFLYNGTFKGIGILHGFWLREMNIIDHEDHFKPLEFSFEDLYVSMDAVTPIGVETFDGIRVEDEEYFYGEFVSVNIGEVREYEIFVKQKDFPTSIEFGYDKASVDTADGSFDEFNTKTTYATEITNNSTEVKLVSKYRADADGIELTRRKVYDKTTSSGSDNDVWMVDTIDLGSKLRTAVRTDHFEYLANVYALDYAYNLRLSPGNNLQRNGSRIKSALSRVGGKLKYSSSTGNSNMESRLIGSSVTVIENGEINIADLMKEKHSELYIKFKTSHKMEELKGTTNGKRNVYGLIEFMTDSGTTLRGYLESVKGKKEKEVILKLKL